ncbi:MAG: hypothetical protein H0X41_09625 [Chitinophagaceae bacterium]|nr:hypothetical protein [Chitinophagaceae bacterium]
MKRSLLIAMIALFILGGASKVSAQKTSSANGSDYTNALGLGIDFGKGETLFGPSVKHFFNENSAGQAEILFGSGLTVLQAFYQYHQEFEGASGLKWYAGVGPQIYLYSGGSDFAISPMAGLDYKITDVPLSLTFDWRPRFILTHGGDFNAARFGIGFRYAFNNK